MLSIKSTFSLYFKLALYFVPFDSWHINFTRVNINQADQIILIQK